MKSLLSPLALRASERIYRLLLLILPATFRKEFGMPMAQVFRDCCRAELAAGGMLGLIALWFRSGIDLVLCAIRQHMSAVRGKLRRFHPVMRVIRHPLVPLSAFLFLICASAWIYTRFRSYQVAYYGNWEETYVVLDRGDFLVRTTRGDTHMSDAPADFQRWYTGSAMPGGFGGTQCVGVHEWPEHPATDVAR